MAFCNCMGGNPCPCELARMARQGCLLPYHAQFFPYQRPALGSFSVSAPMVWADERVPAMRADEV